METDISVVDRKMMEGKTISTPAKIADLARVHNDIIILEDGVNRSIRAINRNIVQVGESITTIENDTNAGFKEVAGRIDTLGDKLTLVEEKVEKIIEDLETRDNFEFDEIRRSSGAERFLNTNRRPEIIPPPPPKTQSQSSSIADKSQSTSLGSNKCKPNNSQNLNEGADLENHENGIYVLGEASSSGPQLVVFNGETASAFDEWIVKFKDYIDVFGTNWSEPEKINRLKLYLGTQARCIFESLLPAERNNLANALKNIRNKLDSPHFRELAYKRLAACYQREGESVSDFIKRLVPLVNTTSSHVPQEAKDETLCRCFMEKVRPEFQRSLQLVGPLIGRKDFDKLTAYVQELEVAAEKEGRLFSDGIHTISDQQGQIPSGRFTNWRPINTYNNPRTLRGFNRNQQGNATSSNAQPLGYRGYRGRSQWQPQNDRRWNNRPFCHYCRRTGHEQYNCRVRRLNNNEYTSNGNRFNERGARKEDQNIKEMVENLAVQVHEMKMSGKYASANQGNIRSLQPVIPPPTPENVETKPEAKGKEEPKKISSWESTGRRVRIPSLMGTSLMLIMMFCCTLAINPVLIPKGPMICQTHKQAMIWEVPEIPSCPTLNLTVKNNTVVEKRRIYVPNSIEFSTKAWACRKIRKNARKYTTITGVPIEEKLSHEEIDLTVEECNQMIKHHSCSLGILKKNSELWQTENKIDLTPRLWVLGSFSWKNISSKNCFLFESIIDSHFGASEIVTPLGFARDCPYSKGNCILEDKTVLVWTVDNVKKCNFIPIGEKEGRCLGKAWLSDDGKLGLTFENETIIEDCGKNITVSDQGLGSVVVASLEQHRTKRHSERVYTKRFSDGLVTSSQLASQLTT
ncbi:unnamed protein product [Meloidogyne enterolobii]|uniref:Uncharacterized protein n=1 Tax=Meloidogyne enterolobii TaxID=390850 RepID=A0ACB0Z1J9_MELEN